MQQEKKRLPWLTVSVLQDLEGLVLRQLVTWQPQTGGSLSAFRKKKITPAVNIAELRLETSISSTGTYTYNYDSNEFGLLISHEINKIKKCVAGNGEGRSIS